ncbi:DUF2550 domain-containing protein [Corynebacterium phocae]|nr:DUF2550 domain-containing protein [Corynebacterium phocae]
MSVALLALVAVIVAMVGLASFRFFKVRSTGAPVLVRPMPGRDVHGWRHGVVRYTPTHLELYKLRSVRVSADVSLSRLDIEIVSHRQLTDAEASFMPEHEEAVHLRAAGQEYELALTGRGAMALHAWVESAPSPRRETLSIKEIRQRSQQR